MYAECNAEEVVECAMEERRDTCSTEEERNKRLAVVDMWTRYSCMDESRILFDDMTGDDNLWTSIEQHVPMVSITATKEKKQTILRAVSFSKQLMKADLMENTTPNTGQALNVPQKITPVFDSVNYTGFRNNPLDYSLPAHHLNVPSESIF